AIGVSNTPNTNPTFSAKHIEVHTGTDLQNTLTGGTFMDGSLDGAFSVNLGTGAVTGTVTALSMNFNGQFLEASGFSVSATELFNAGNSTMTPFDVQFDTLFSHILSGNDLIIGQTGSQLLKGYAGNDTLVAGGDASTLVGGAGGDQYDLGFTTSNLITELAAGGTDTVRTFNSYALGEGNNIENLVLLG